MKNKNITVQGSQISIVLSPVNDDYISLTNKSGRYGGGTYAHKDIAFNQIAISQMKSLVDNGSVKKLK